jgi:cell division protein FtsA
MARKGKYIAAIDLGSAKTAALICEPDEAGKLTVIGMGSAESRGWRKGAVVNLDLAVLATKKAVEIAESAAGVPIGAAYVGVGGPDVKGISSRGAISLGERKREVLQNDVVAVVQKAKGVSLPQDREILHALQQEYFLDSQNGIRNPVGMTSHKLEAEVHLVTATSTATRNIVTVLNLAGIEVPDNGTILEPLAAAQACLTADERELGAALIDVGAGGTGLVVYYQGSLRYSAVIPVGGEHFTNDIAVGLRTPIPEAEKMKRAWGDRTPGKSEAMALEVPSVGDRPSHIVTYATLSEIIEPRAMELLELIQTELGRSGYAGQLRAGLVLTGGGAKLGGLTALAEQILSLQVRVASPGGLKKMGEILPDPVYSVLAGLVLHGNRQRLLRGPEDQGLLGKLMRLFRGKN